MLRTLDPFCSVVTGQEAATLTGFDQNFGVGIDLVDRTGSGPLVIKAVVPGGPAQRAGLQAGDHITSVDDKETTTLSTEQALRFLNGGTGDMTADLLRPPPIPGTPGDASNTPVQVHLTVRTLPAMPNGKSHCSATTSCRRPSRGLSAPRIIRGTTGLIAGSVSRRSASCSWPGKGFTAVELERVLTRLDSTGEGLGGLILDLRWCPGGYLASATATAELFLEEGVIATTQVRRRAPASTRRRGVPWVSSPAFR